MGLFDLIHAPAGLPGLSPHALVLKTRELGEHMHAYELTADGNLMQHAASFLMLGADDADGTGDLNAAPGFDWSLSAERVALTAHPVTGTFRILADVFDPESDEDEARVRLDFVGGAFVQAVLIDGALPTVPMDASFWRSLMLTGPFTCRTPERETPLIQGPSITYASLMQ